MELTLSKVMIFLFFASVILTACRKNDSDRTIRGAWPPPSSPQGPASKPSGILVGNKEYFWKKSWDTSAVGYKIILETWRLTPEAINRGIDVYVALSTEMSPFDKIPRSILDPFFTDTVHLSFDVMPEKLQLIARSTVDMTKAESDMYIEYH